MKVLTQVLPVAMLVLQFLSGIAYAFTGDIRRAIYWLAAAVLTGAVTF